MRKVMVVIFMLITQFSYAQDNMVSEIDFGEFTFINEGEVASFTGIILTPNALATILVSNEFSLKKCELDNKYEIDVKKKTIEMMEDMYESERQLSEGKHNELVILKDEEIERLQNIVIDGPNNYNHWWGAGGFVAGVAVSIGIFYISTEIVINQ